MTPDDATNLLTLLANFAAWLDPMPGRDTDMAYYRQLAQQYLESQGQHLIVDVPEDRQSWCDLCGQSFWKPPRHAPEQLTGHQYCWCPTCLDQQSRVWSHMGGSAYQKTWANAAEG